ncbi:MAG TPA: HU family DNA-binding protein [bacterium]|nr:HU family DNA-binding protein [bacterium]HPN30148.1 HU family DNA-binding protein [bacterium]
MNITRFDLTAMISERTPSLDSDMVNKMVNRIFDVIIEELSNENKIEFRNFGRFFVKKKRGRIAHNPKTLEKVEVAPRLAPVFKIGKLFKEEIEIASKKSAVKFAGSRY